MSYCYLDHAATTPMRPQAVAAMLPFLSEQFANPSGSHRFAREARRAIDEARDVVAAAIGCRPGEVIFTSGGTEADNTAVFGALERHAGAAVCSAVEHHAVLEAVAARNGVVVGVDRVGHIDLALLAEVLAGSDATAIVSVMAVNNEVGTITDLGAVAEIVRRCAPGAVLHTDAVQAACWLDLAEVWSHVDALSLSAHKFGGPKGVGVLAVRAGTTISPLLIGGGQEREMRSGTHNVGGIVALAEALRLAAVERVEEGARIGALRDRLVDRLLAEVPGVVETVPRERKVAGSAHVCIEGVENEALLYLLDEAEVCATAAASCASGAMEPSHVLAAMGVPRSLANGALRLTLGRTTTAADIDRGAAAVIAAVPRLRTPVGAAMKVLVALSGGVDSSVAAAELVRAGHHVVGVTMRLWGGDSDTGCCSVADVDDARRVAQQLDIDHLVFNFGDDFAEHVVQPYVDAHRDGVTPNPCIECNRHLKFARLAERADLLGFDAVATGHHARIVPVDGVLRVARGADAAKDQSYVVHMIDQAQLARTQFPVGHLTKAHVRERATELGLRTADKPDSQDVCFITSTGGRATFLGARIPLRSARVVDTAGVPVGVVDAVELVTLGQRRGLGLPGGGTKRYVVDVDVAHETVTVGDERDLLVDVQRFADAVWGHEPVAGEVLVQCSAHGAPLPAVLDGDELRWARPERLVAPGQSLVFYDPSDRYVLGGAHAAVGRLR